jgi:hypothetical protein
MPLQVDGPFHRSLGTTGRHPCHSRELDHPVGPSSYSRFCDGCTRISRTVVSQSRGWPSRSCGRRTEKLRLPDRWRQPHHHCHCPARLRRDFPSAKGGSVQRDDHSDRFESGRPAVPPATADFATGVQEYPEPWLLTEKLRLPDRWRQPHHHCHCPARLRRDFPSAKGDAESVENYDSQCEYEEDEEDFHSDPRLESRSDQDV